MAQRRRMIDPSFWTDTLIGEMSIGARLAFVGMISHADDEGRLEASAKYIRRCVFGFDEGMSLDEVAGYLSEIKQACRNVIFYETDGREYAAFAKWKEYQYIQKKQASKLPAPPSSEQYDTDTIPVSYLADNPLLSVSPNRIEENRIEINPPTEGDAPAPATKQKPQKSLPGINPPRETEPDPTVQHPAVQAFKSFHKLKNTPPQEARKAISETVDDLSLWETTMRNWSIAGYSPTNALGQLDWYRMGGQPHAGRSNGKQNGHANAPPVISPVKTMDEINAEAARRLAAREARNGQVQVDTRSKPHTG